MHSRIAMQLIWQKAKNYSSWTKALYLGITICFLAAQITLIVKSKEPLTAGMMAMSYSVAVLFSLKYFIALGVIKDLLEERTKR